MNRRAFLAKLGIGAGVAALGAAAAAQTAKADGEGWGGAVEPPKVPEQEAVKPRIRFKEKGRRITGDLSTWREVEDGDVPGAEYFEGHWMSPPSGSNTPRWNPPGWFLSQPLYREQR